MDRPNSPQRDAGETERAGGPRENGPVRPGSPFRRHGAAGGPAGVSLDFDQAPFLVIWETQVNTVVARHNIDDIEGLLALMEELGIVFWEVFFLVPMGRARLEDVASADEFEMVFNKLYDLSKTASFDIKATAAPQYSRLVLERKVEERRAGKRGESSDVLTDGVAYSQKDGIGRARGVSDGDGFMFVSHKGDIYPSGFLPVSAGNVRRNDLVDVYRNAPLFKELRNRSLAKGKCGVCEYLSVCGGSRARAYAVTGGLVGGGTLLRSRSEEVPADGGGR